MAADTYTPRLGWILQGTGNNNNSWGVNLNTALTVIDSAIAGRYTNTVTGGTLDLDNTIPPSGTHPLPEMIVDLAGTLASNQIVLVPNVSKLWLVRNNCTLGAYTLTFKTASGSASAAIPVGWSFVWCNGSDVMYVGLSTSLRDVQWLGADGTLALPGISFSNEATLGMRRVSAGVMALVVGGVDVATIDAGGINLAAGLTYEIGGGSVIPTGTELAFAGMSCPDGFYFEYGQAVSRTTDAALFAALTITVSATRNANTSLTSVGTDLTGLGLEGAYLEGTGITAGTTLVSMTATTITMSQAASGSGAITLRILPHGYGDSSTTFNLPDRRGRVLAGRDNMGATSANRLTGVTGSLNGDKLNATGGAETLTLARSDLPNDAVSVTVSVTDPGHTHPYTDVGTAGPLGQGSNGGYASLSSTARTTSSNTTGITASGSFNLNGSVTQTTPALIQPTGITNWIIKR
jgi:microcystin-dependent protein